MTIPIAHAGNALAVPLSAVFKGENDSRIVYVLKDDETTEPKEVVIGVTNLDYAEIKSGIGEGERVFTVEPKKVEKSS